MSLMQKTASGCRGAAISRRTAVIRAESRSTSVVERVQMAAATLATAAFLVAPSAQAGLVIEQPKLKKAFFSDDSAPAAPRAPMEIKGLQRIDKSAAPAVAATPSAPSPKFEGPELGFDPNFLSLPASIGGIAAVAFAFIKLDAGFLDFIAEASSRDSNNYAGYEPTLKPDSGVITYANAGTKKFKAPAKKTTKK